jgi:hypothetical protein
MARLKGLRTLNRAIQAEVADFGIEKITMSEWMYDTNKNEINYTLLDNRLEDRWFLKFVKERFGYKPKNSFLLSLFHELGHHFTYDDIIENDTLGEFCYNEKNRIDKEMKATKNEKLQKKLEWQYFSLPDEIIATAWAVDYMKNHEEEIEQMWERINKAIVDFYMKNITEEG